jgi:hypothetical protein
MTTTEERYQATPLATDLNNSVLKKPVRLAPDKMGIMIHEPYVKALHVDDNITWFQQILTDQGLLLKPVHGMPSLRDPDDGKGSEERREK